MKYEWQDLPERKNLFTVKNTAMINLNTGKIIRHYATNTKIAVVQKCITPEKTYYRTYEAAYHYLNYAFEAEAFGLPNEKAPSAPSNSPMKKNTPNSSRKTVGGKKQTSSKKEALFNGGETMLKRMAKILFRRKDG